MLQVVKYYWASMNLLCCKMMFTGLPYWIKQGKILAMTILSDYSSKFLIAGVAVGLKNWLRVTFAIEPSSLDDGLARIKAFYQRHAKKHWKLFSMRDMPRNNWSCFLVRTMQVSFVIDQSPWLSSLNQYLENNHLFSCLSGRGVAFSCFCEITWKHIQR